MQRTLTRNKTYQSNATGRGAVTSRKNINILKSKKVISGDKVSLIAKSQKLPGALHITSF